MRHEKRPGAPPQRRHRASFNGYIMYICTGGQKVVKILSREDERSLLQRFANGDLPVPTVDNVPSINLAPVRAAHNEPWHRTRLQRLENATGGQN